MSKKKPAANKPLPEEALDKMIDALDGPLNGAAEKVLKNRLVLAPLGLSMTLSFKMMKLAKKTFGGDR